MPDPAPPARPAPGPAGPPPPDERATLVQVGFCLGCGGIILAVFLLLGLTVWSSDRQFLSERAPVEANLRAIVPCEPPPGYRGFVGARVGGSQPQRIAVLVAESYTGERVPVDARLSISAWSFPAERSPAERRAEVERYWDFKIADERGEPPTVASSRELALRVGGSQRPAWERILESKELRLRSVVVLVPAEAGLVALGFLGLAEDFDQEAMERFLASVP